MGTVAGTFEDGVSAAATVVAGATKVGTWL
jgi:hypothetical protein